MQKRTEITIETERLLVISRRRERAILWCNGCDKNVPMLTVYEAASTASRAQCSPHGNNRVAGGAGVMSPIGLDTHDKGQQ